MLGGALSTCWDALLGSLWSLPQIRQMSTVLRYAQDSLVKKLGANCIQITAYLAAGLVFTTSAVNSLVYSPEGAEEAAAAGFILLSMIAVGHGITLPTDAY